jgi:hypothetical protein
LFFVLIQESLSVFFVGFPQVLRAEDIDHGSCESPHDLQDYIFPNAYLIIKGVNWTPIGKHTNNRNTLYQWVCIDLARCTPPKLKTIILLLNGSCNCEEQTLMHLKPPPKILLRIVCVWVEIISHDLGMPFRSISVDVQSAELGS